MVDVPAVVGAGDPVGKITYSQATFPVAPVQLKSAVVPVIFSTVNADGGIHAGGSVMLTIMSTVTPHEPL